MSGGRRALSRAAALASVLVLSLAGCQRPSEAPPREQDKALQRAVEAPLERARAVEDEVREGKQRKDREIEEQGG